MGQWNNYLGPSTTVQPLYTWYHIVFTYSPSQSSTSAIYAIYINGIQDAAGTTTGDVPLADVVRTYGRIGCSWTPR